MVSDARRAVWRPFRVVSKGNRRIRRALARAKRIRAMFLKDRVVVGMVLAVVCLSVAAGCQGRGALIPPTDPDLKKTAAQFAADSAKRQYPASAPRGGELQAMASIDYGVFNRVEIMNLSDEDYNDVEIWMN